MDGLSTSHAAGLAGALAAQPSASQEQLRRAAAARRRQATAAAETESDASDPPVESVNETEAILSKLPEHKDAPPEKSSGHPHIDVTA